MVTIHNGNVSRRRAIHWTSNESSCQSRDTCNFLTLLAAYRPGRALRFNLSGVRALYFILAGFLLSVFSHAQQCQLSDITQLGDPVISTSNHGPGVGGPVNAIDDDPATRYLNFDRVNTGFTIFPQVGLSVVHALALTSADDAPDRDPTSYTLEGSYSGSNFTMIASGTVPAFPTRFHKQTILFTNFTPYLFYRIIFPTINGSTCCMQIAEVELLGLVAPSDVTLPADPIVAISPDGPGLEDVRKAIDNQLTDYVLFDSTNAGLTITPSLGPTILSGLAVTSAFNSPDRDPTTYALSGSLDGTNFSPISSGTIPAFAWRNQTNFMFFSATGAYTTYRLAFPTVNGSTCCLQIGEVELLGTVPKPVEDVTRADDRIVAIGNSSTETTVSNAIMIKPPPVMSISTSAPPASRSRPASAQPYSRVLLSLPPITRRIPTRHPIR